VLLPKVDDEATVSQLVRHFATEADAAVAGSYAGRLMRL
jgi:hypothetical protein